MEYLMIYHHAKFQTNSSKIDRDISKKLIFGSKNFLKKNLKKIEISQKYFFYIFLLLVLSNIYVHAKFQRSSAQFETLGIFWNQKRTILTRFWLESNLWPSVSRKLAVIPPFFLCSTPTKSTIPEILSLLPSKLID